MGWAYDAYVGEEREPHTHTHRLLVKNPEEKRPLGRPRPRCEDNIKMDLKGTRESVDWIDLAQNRDKWQDPWAQ